jgi:hypothetical protein
MYIWSRQRIVQCSIAVIAGDGKHAANAISGYRALADIPGYLPGSL